MKNKKIFAVAIIAIIVVVAAFGIYNTTISKESARLVHLERGISGMVVGSGTCTQCVPGTSSSATPDGGDCWCDEYCVGNGDCCNNYVSLCQGGTVEEWKGCSSGWVCSGGTKITDYGDYMIVGGTTLEFNGISLTTRVIPGVQTELWIYPPGTSGVPNCRIRMDLMGDGKVDCTFPDMNLQVEVIKEHYTAPGPLIYETKLSKLN